MVKDFFSNNGATDYRIDQIQFANGAIWDIGYLLDKVRQATIGDDKIYGYDNKSDVLEGKEGAGLMFLVGIFFYLCYVFGLHILCRWLYLIFRPFIKFWELDDE